VLCGFDTMARAMDESVCCRLLVTVSCDNRFVSIAHS